MAKLQKTMSFNNAMIDMNTMELVEHSKDGDPTGRFALKDIFQEWDNVYGISLTIKRAVEVFSSNDEGVRDEEYADEDC